MSTVLDRREGTAIPREVRGVTAAEARAQAEALVFGRLEARLAPLEALARGLWLATLTNSQGGLETRLPGISTLHASLAAGLTDHGDWLDPALATRIVETLDSLALPAFCADKPELAEQVLRSLLWHLDRIVDYVDRGNDQAAARDKALADFAGDWQERCNLIDELATVFGEMGDLDKHTRWDLLRGALKSGAWQEVLRVRALIEHLPELVRVIRRLGRARPAEQQSETMARAIETQHLIAAPRAARRTTRVPDLPGETRGITRAGRIARMLPSESMLLAHPRLRLIWHARHAERTLLCYDDDDRLEDSHDVRLPALAPSPQRRPDRPPEAGPMLVCVDTSASMRGGAEAVAKAVVLEAARTAFAEQRACQVLAFGGTDELIEFTVSRDVAGVTRLAEFLGQSFAGGTDICAPLERALERVRADGWRNADLLIASDGEFGATPDKAEALRNAKGELGLRVQGVLIGDRETIGFLEVADDILWVRDWRRFGDSTADSPVHSQRLTAIYFPGSLRGASAADAPPPDPAEAFRRPLAVRGKS
ncbi:MAG TPA: VWA domain-containing protein [Rhodocyclaceae bacterium]